MPKCGNTLTLLRNLVVGLVLGGLIVLPARAVEPIKIGFGMGLTGGLAASGKAALLAMKIWEEETNAEGGLLGRPVKLIYYDDQSNPATVPGIFTKLLDIDKVDLVCGDYGTNLLAPAMIARVFGFGFCAAATSKKPWEKLAEGSNPPVGAITKYLG